MYLDYEKIFSTLALFTPIRLRKNVREIGYNLKIKQNLTYIKRNQKHVLKTLKEKVKRGEKLNVAFYIYDETKWKNQSTYDLMEKSEIFEPWVFVTRNAPLKRTFGCVTPKEMHNIFRFFKSKNMRVKYAYDFEKDDFIPFENMNPKPDIIIYSHPWYVHKTQGPVMASKYALTYYIPYSVSASTGPQEWNLRFYLYVGCQYVLNDLIKKHFSINMSNKGINLKSAGCPILDYFYLNKNKKYDNKNTIIYAPHFSVTENTILKWGTFLQLGEFILEWAKAHPEFNYIYKPHPCLKSFLEINRLWSSDKIKNYWDSWAKIGQVCESGDYLDMFMESRAMLTDCGSFKTEYFMTQKPQIYLKSPNGVPFNSSVSKINETSYPAQTPEELEKVLDEVLVKGNDYKKEERRKVYQEYGYENTYAAQNIIDDIKKTVGCNV